MPSSTGYLVSAIVIAVGLFFGLWWILVRGGDEAPWLPAGLAASVVLLVALSAREVVMRRAWTKLSVRKRNPAEETRPASAKVAAVAKEDFLHQSTRPHSLDSKTIHCC